MENFLDRIVRQRRQTVARDCAGRDATRLRATAEAARQSAQPHRFRDALRDAASLHIIGEFKRASPSAGVIRADLAPADVASSYERAGVSAISVLTESDFFHGSLDDLREVRRASGLPILRKDFTIDEAQIYEAALAGADAILLIVAALTDPELMSFRATAEALGLDALIEVHTADEMRRAVDLGAELLGVNNRDLFTLQVSVETSLRLAPLAPPGALLISESGLSSLDDFRRLAAAGYRGFLVGESLMRAADPAALLAEWRGLDLQEVSRA